MLPDRQFPRHIAIVMDGNGRWAQAQGMGRTRGHKQGVEAASNIIEVCAQKQIEVLTLFAFGMENWKRPSKEVRNLFRLFLLSLKRKLNWLTENNIILKIIGDKTRFSTHLQRAIEETELLTSKNTGLQLNIAVNYSGRWDMVQAMAKWQLAHPGEVLSNDSFTQYLMLSGLPEPELFIRPGGVQRISNFMLWELAYTELYFTPILWPDFTETELNKALDFFASSQRRFGLTAEQVQEQNQHA